MLADPEDHQDKPKKMEDKQEKYHMSLGIIRDGFVAAKLLKPDAINSMEKNIASQYSRGCAQWDGPAFRKDHQFSTSLVSILKSGNEMATRRQVEHSAQTMAFYHALRTSISFDQAGDKDSTVEFPKDQKRSPLSFVISQIIEANSSQSSFLDIFKSFTLSQKPFGLNLCSAEHFYFSDIAKKCEELLGDLSKEKFRDACTSLIRYWLARGSIEDILRAVLFLLSRCKEVSNLDLGGYLMDWESILNQAKLCVIRTSRQKHLTNLTAVAGQVKVSCGPAPPSIGFPNEKILILNELDMYSKQLRLSENAIIAYEDELDIHSGEPPFVKLENFDFRSWKKKQQHDPRQIKNDADSKKVPHRTISCDPEGAYLYSLCQTYGLLKIGTGAGGTIAGMVNRQNSKLAFHVGAQIVCTDISLLMRSPVLGGHILLEIDRDSLSFTSKRIALSRSNFDPKDQKPWGTCPSWKLEYEDDEEDQEEHEVKSLGPSLTEQVKVMLCQNWDFGTKCVDQDKSANMVVFQEDGLLFEKDGGAFQLRIRQNEVVLPMFFKDNELFSLEVRHCNQVDKYALAMDNFKVPPWTEGGKFRASCIVCASSCEVFLESMEQCRQWACQLCSKASNEVTSAALENLMLYHDEDAPMPQTENGGVSPKSETPINPNNLIIMEISCVQRHIIELLVTKNMHKPEKATSCDACGYCWTEGQTQYECLEQCCRGFRMCKFCFLVGSFGKSGHRREHRTNVKEHTEHSKLERCVSLDEVSAFADIANNIVVFCQPNHRKRCFLRFNFLTGRFLHENVLSTHGNAFTLNPSSLDVWSIGDSPKQIEKWSFSNAQCCVSAVNTKDLGSLQIARIILKNMNCLPAVFALNVNELIAAVDVSYKLEKVGGDYDVTCSLMSIMEKHVAWVPTPELTKFRDLLCGISTSDSQLHSRSEQLLMKGFEAFYPSWRERLLFLCDCLNQNRGSFLKNLTKQYSAIWTGNTRSHIARVIEEQDVSAIIEMQDKILDVIVEHDRKYSECHPAVFLLLRYQSELFVVCEEGKPQQLTHEVRVFGSLCCGVIAMCNKMFAQNATAFFETGIASLLPICVLGIPKLDLKALPHAKRRAILREALHFCFELRTKIQEPVFPNSLGDLLQTRNFISSYDVFREIFTFFAASKSYLSKETFAQFLSKCGIALASDFAADRIDDTFTYYGVSDHGRLNFDGFLRMCVDRASKNSDSFLNEMSTLHGAISRELCSKSCQLQMDILISLSALFERIHKIPEATDDRSALFLMLEAHKLWPHSDCGFLEFLEGVRNPLLTLFEKCVGEIGQGFTYISKFLDESILSLLAHAERSFFIACIKVSGFVNHFRTFRASDEIALLLAKRRACTHCPGWFRTIVTQIFHSIRKHIVELVREVDLTLTAGLPPDTEQKIHEFLLRILSNAKFIIHTPNIDADSQGVTVLGKRAGGDSTEQPAIKKLKVSTNGETINRTCTEPTTLAKGSLHLLLSDSLEKKFGSIIASTQICMSMQNDVLSILVKSLNGETDCSVVGSKFVVECVSRELSCRTVGQGVSKTLIEFLKKLSQALRELRLDKQQVRSDIKAILRIFSMQFRPEDLASILMEGDVLTSLLDFNAKLNSFRQCKAASELGTIRMCRKWVWQVMVPLLTLAMSNLENHAWVAAKVVPYLVETLSHDFSLIQSLNAKENQITRFLDLTACRDEIAELNEAVFRSIDVLKILQYLKHGISNPTLLQHLLHSILPSNPSIPTVVQVEIVKLVQKELATSSQRLDFTEIFKQFGSMLPEVQVLNEWTKNGWTKAPRAKEDYHESKQKEEKDQHVNDQGLSYQTWESAEGDLTLLESLTCMFTAITPPLWNELLANLSLLQKNGWKLSEQVDHTLIFGCLHVLGGHLPTLTHGCSCVVTVGERRVPGVVKSVRLNKVTVKFPRGTNIKSGKPNHKMEMNFPAQVVEVVPDQKPQSLASLPNEFGRKLLQITQTWNDTPTDERSKYLFHKIKCKFVIMLLRQVSLSENKQLFLQFKTEIFGFLGQEWGSNGLSCLPSPQIRWNSSIVSSCFGLACSVGSNWNEFLDCMKPPQTKKSSPKASVPVVPQHEIPIEKKPDILQQVDQIVAMGFSEVQAKYALVQVGGDLPRAVEFVLTSLAEGIDEMEVSDGWDRLLHQMGIHKRVRLYQQKMQASGFPDVSGHQLQTSKRIKASQIQLLFAHSWSRRSTQHKIDNAQKFAWIGSSTKLTGLQVTVTKAAVEDWQKCVPSKEELCMDEEELKGVEGGSSSEDDCSSENGACNRNSPQFGERSKAGEKNIFCPFKLDGCVATIVRVSKEFNYQQEGDEKSFGYVLLKISDATYFCSVYAWMKLSLLDPIVDSGEDVCMMNSSQVSYLTPFDSLRFAGLKTTDYLSLTETLDGHLFADIAKSFLDVFFFDSPRLRDFVDFSRLLSSRSSFSRSKAFDSDICDHETKQYKQKLLASFEIVQGDEITSYIGAITSKLDECATNSQSFFDKLNANANFLTQPSLQSTCIKTGDSTVHWQVVHVLANGKERRYTHNFVIQFFLDEACNIRLTEIYSSSKTVSQILVLPNPAYVKVLEYGKPQGPQTDRSTYLLFHTPGTTTDLEQLLTMAEFTFKIWCELRSDKKMGPEVESLLFRVLQDLLTFLIKLNNPLPQPTNMKARIYEVMVSILSSWIVFTKQVPVQCAAFLAKFLQETTKTLLPEVCERYNLGEAQREAHKKAKGCMYLKLMIEVLVCGCLLETRLGEASFRRTVESRLPLVKEIGQMIEKGEHLVVKVPLTPAKVMQLDLSQSSMWVKFCNVKDSTALVASSLLPKWSDRWELLMQILDATAMPAALRPPARPAREHRVHNWFHHQPSVSSVVDQLPQLQFKHYGKFEEGKKGLTLFAQFCEQFVRLSFPTKPERLRTKVNEIPWRTQFLGASDEGAHGNNGPFCQILYETCDELSDLAADRTKSKYEVVIRSPNDLGDIGEFRDRLLINPSFSSPAQLKSCFILGQLMAVSIRSCVSLNISLAPHVWKQLLGLPLHKDDLACFDCAFWRSLAHIEQCSEEEFQKVFSDKLEWSVLLSDEVTSVPLTAPTKSPNVSWASRSDFVEQATQARLHESAFQIAMIRKGVDSVIPRSALTQLVQSGAELELLVCGDPTVDLAVLKACTTYQEASHDTPVVEMFWNMLENFSNEERKQFLRFAWARDRLPVHMGSNRMQVKVFDIVQKRKMPVVNAPPAAVSQGEPRASDSAGAGAAAAGVAAGQVAAEAASSEAKTDIADMAIEDEGFDTYPLPSAETCFFNVNLPMYPSLEVMRRKFRTALDCVHITS